MHIGCSGILFNMVSGRRLGNREDRRVQREKCERDLARRRIMRTRDVRKYATSGRMQIRKAAMSERAVRRDSDAVLLAPRQHSMLDGALLQIIEDLIAGQAAGPRYFPGLFEIRHSEIAYAIGKNLALAAKCLES